MVQFKNTRKMFTYECYEVGDLWMILWKGKFEMISEMMWTVSNLRETSMVTIQKLK